MRTNVILFAAGSSQVDAKGLEVISVMSNLARRCTGVRIKVAGHGDGSPTDAAAVSLSRQRAFAVSQLLREAGVAPARLVAVGEVAMQSADDAAGARDDAYSRVEISVIP